MNNRSGFVIIALTVVAVTGYNLRDLEMGGDTTARPAGKPPIIDPVPALVTAPPAGSGIGSYEVWNLRNSPLPGGLPPLNELFKPYYTLNKTGRFEAIQRSDRPAERWEFQGVVMRGEVPRALFYNAGLRKLRNLGRGEMVDERLAIRSIGTSSVVLEVVGQKKPQKFQLRIFNSNRDSYAAKRKIS